MAAKTRAMMTPGALFNILHSTQLACVVTEKRAFSHILSSPGAFKVGAEQLQVAVVVNSVQQPAARAVAPMVHANDASPLAEYDVEASDSSDGEDSDAPFARADAAAAPVASGGSPLTDAVPSADGRIVDEDGVDECEEDEDDDEQADAGGSYSDVDGGSDSEDSAIRCRTLLVTLLPT